jgi:2-polyprenyl-6-methoxyphenol hydroxylase-like FAD-dependent oxidoreductase
MRILIVGGGPSGLITAYVLALSRRHSKIVLIEKYPQRSREQILVVEEHLFSILTHILGKETIDNICKTDLPAFDTSGACFLGKGNPNNLQLRTLRIKDLEEIFLNALKTFDNVMLLYPEHIDGRSDIKYEGNGSFLFTVTQGNFQNYNDQKLSYSPNVVIAADGINSTIAKMFGNITYKETLRESKGYVHFIDHEIPNHIHKNIDIETSVNCSQNRYRFFVGRFPNKEVKNQVGKSYLGIQLYPDEKINLAELVRNGLRYYGIEERNIQLKNEEVFDIKPCIKSRCYDLVDGMSIFYIGDSYISVNFFSGTGVNYGAAMAIVLADLLSFSSCPINDFDNFVNSYINLDFSKAVQLSDFINIKTEKFNEFILLLPYIQRSRILSLDSNERKKFILSMPSFIQYTTNQKLPDCLADKTRAILNISNKYNKFDNIVQNIMTKYNYRNAVLKYENYPVLISKRNYVPLTETELALYIGEQVYYLGNSDNGWIIIMNSLGKTGYVPATYF